MQEQSKQDDLKVAKEETQDAFNNGLNSVRSPIVAPSGEIELETEKSPSKESTSKGSKSVEQ